MKKIEVELLLLDLENASFDMDRKLRKLDTIITYYLGETTPSSTPEPEPNEPVDVDEVEVDTEVEDEEKVKEEKQEAQEEQIDDLPIEPKDDLLPQDIKNIYRKIMMKTHPDKTKGKSYEEEYEEYYKQAVTAKNENDKAEIIFIAYRLNIKEVFEIDEAHFGNIRYKIKTLELQVTQLDNNPFWVWYHTDNKALKNIMIQQITKMRSGQKK